jgi:hypothetical protein
MVRAAFQPVGVCLSLALFAARAAAQTPAVPDAPMVPEAPSLPPAAIIKAPLAPSVSQEIIDERPSPQHVWIAGHWRWQDGNYVWIASHWELPPRANLAWVEPRWDQKANGYVLAGGYWQDAGPQVVVVTPSAPPPPAPVIVEQAPPGQIREYITERPSPYHVWIGGYWSWQIGRHVWISGHWDLPPRSNVVWVEPRWERRDRGYVLVEGYWREATPMRFEGRGEREVVIMREPPPPVRERRGPQPSSRHVWIAGYWAWHDGRHVWLSGHWELPPRPRAEWVEPRWEHRGNGYVFIEGVWH